MDGVHGIEDVLIDAPNPRRGTSLPDTRATDNTLALLKPRSESGRDFIATQANDVERYIRKELQKLTTKRKSCGDTPQVEGPLRKRNQPLSAITETRAGSSPHDTDDKPSGTKCRSKETPTLGRRIPEPLEALDCTNVDWIPVPTPHTPQLAYLMQTSPHTKARLVTCKGENRLFIPCLDTRSVLADSLDVREPKDNNVGAALIIFAAGQIRLRQEQCTQCLWKAEEESKQDQQIAPSPFLACATAGTTMDGVCSGCVLDGGTRLDMISRCSVALTTLSPKRNYDLKANIKESLRDSSLFLGEYPAFESFLRQFFQLPASTDPEQDAGVQATVTDKDGANKPAKLDCDGIAETEDRSTTPQQPATEPRV